MLSQTHFKKEDTLLKKYEKSKEIKKWNSPNYFYEINWYNEIKKWKQTIIELENEIRGDIQNIVDLFDKTYFKKWIKAIKNYTLTWIDRRLDLRARKLDFLTNEIQPVVRTYVDRLVQSLFRTSFYIKAYPLSKWKADRVKKMQHLIERWFASSKAKKALLDVWTTAITNWIWYVRSWFNAPSDVAKDMLSDKPKVYNVDSFYTVFERVSEFCIFWEPFIPFDKQRFVIYRKIIPLQDALVRIWCFNKTLTDEQKEIIINNPKPINTKNYDKVRLIKYYEEDILNQKEYNIDNYYNTTFWNDFCEYIERRDRENLILMINWYIVYDGPNPLENRMSPFHYLNSTNMPWTWIADGIWTILEWPQKLYDALYNMSFDLMKFQAGPMFLKQPWVDIEWMTDVLNYRPFTFVQIEWPWKLETLQMPTPDPSIYKGMTDILNMANMSISPASYSQYEWVSRSATDSQARLEWLKDATVVLITNMNRLLTEVAEVWLEEMKIKMPEKFSIPIFDKWWDIKDWDEISIKDLEWKYLFEWDSESIRDLNKVVDRAQLTQLSQFIKMFWQDPIDWKRLIDTRSLLKEWLSLFWKEHSGLIISDEEYTKAVEDSQKLKIKLQKVLQDYQQSIMWQQPQVQWIGPWSQRPEWQEIAEPWIPQWWSNYNNNPNAQQIWQEQEPQWWIDLASILKQANE